MAFNISNKAFEEAFGKDISENNKKGPQDDKEVIDKFLIELKKYLKTQNKNPSAVAIYHWMNNGGKIASFTCRADMVESMEKALKGAKIPFILVQEAKGDFGFLIRSKDKESEKAIAREVLKKSTEYCSITNGEEAGKVYLKSKEKDKTMIAVTNLSLEEVSSLETFCNDVMRGETIGIDKMEDGTYTVSCHGATAVDWRRKKPFPLALAKSVVKMNGSTAKESRAEAKLNQEYRRAKVQGFPDQNGENKKPVWVVGHQNKFVKRTSRGFELGHAEEVGDNVILESDLKVDVLDPRYTERLNSALAKITGHRCLYTLPDVIAYFKTRKPNYKNNKLEAEFALLNEVDKVVSSKIKQDSISKKEGNWQYKLQHYQNELSKVLIAIRDMTIPKGYTKDQIMALINIQNVLQVDPRSLTPSIEKFLSVGIYEKYAGPQKVVDIEKHIDKFKGKNKEEPTIEQRRDIRDSGFEGR